MSTFETKLHQMLVEYCHTDSEYTPPIATTSAPRTRKPLDLHGLDLYEIEELQASSDPKERQLGRQAYAIWYNDNCM